MIESSTRALVDGLEEIGRALHLQVFTAPNGIALLDWVPDEHRVLTVWVHAGGAEVRIGHSVHVVVPVASPADVQDLLEVLRRVLTEGAWFESFEIDPRRGRLEPVAWRLGTGPLHLRSSTSSGRPASRPAGRQLRFRCLGETWGPTG